MGGYFDDLVEEILKRGWGRGRRDVTFSLRNVVWLGVDFSEGVWYGGGSMLVGTW